MTGIVSPSDLRALVAGAYQEVIAEIPAKLPQLHEIDATERERLVKFAAAVLRRHGVEVVL